MARTVLITGAGSGFGKLTALALAARGHRVLATCETDAQVTALAAEAPQLEVRRLDVTTDDVEWAREVEIDVLINNAGLGQTGPIADVPIDRVRRLFEVNVFGTLRLTQVVAPQMVARGSGRILILSSIAGHLVAPTFGPYSMTKFALEAMGKALRAELAPAGVDVALVNPGPYATGFNDTMAASMWEWFGDGATSAAGTKITGEFVVTGQLDPKEVADALVALVEADRTAESNFIPAELVGLVSPPQVTVPQP